MKFTDEQLSTILGEHSAGQLVAGGGENWNLNFCKRNRCYECMPRRIQ